MKKFCMGAGVFDTETVETHVLRQTRGHLSAIVVYHANGKWVLEQVRSGQFDLSLMTPEVAAGLFTSHGKDIPASLIAEL